MKRRNAKDLSERCECTNQNVRCTLIKNHKGKHLGSNDKEWSDK